MISVRFSRAGVDPANSGPPPGLELRVGMDYTTYPFFVGQVYIVHSAPEYEGEAPSYYPVVEYLRDYAGGGTVKWFHNHETGSEVAIDTSNMTLVKPKGGSQGGWSKRWKLWAWRLSGAVY